MGARGLNFPSTEAFYRRGLLDDVKASSFGWMGGDRPGMEFNGKGKVAEPPGAAPRFAGHFAGIMLDASKVDFSNQKWIIPGPSVGGGMVSLEAIEHLLAHRAMKLGVDVRYGQEVVGFTETTSMLLFKPQMETSRRSGWSVATEGEAQYAKLPDFHSRAPNPSSLGTWLSSNLMTSTIWLPAST